MSDIIFDIVHLERYAIIEEPGAYIIKNNSTADYYNLYDKEGNPRWLLNLKAISKDNLEVVKQVSASDQLLFYSDIGHLLMTGALWEDQVKMPIDMPAKGEELIAMFDLIDDILLCTGITLIPRRKPKLFYPSYEYLKQIEDFAELFININNNEDEF